MTQEQIVLEHMKKHGSISRYEALLVHRIAHLPTRIFDLKKAGHEIISEWKIEEMTGKRYVRYSLKEAA